MIQGPASMLYTKIVVSSSLKIASRTHFHFDMWKRYPFWSQDNFSLPFHRKLTSKHIFLRHSKRASRAALTKRHQGATRTIQAVTSRKHLQARPAAATDWCTYVVGSNIFSNVSGVTYNVAKQSLENFVFKILKQNEIWKKKSEKKKNTDRMREEKREKNKIKNAYNTRYSQAVTHPSTDRARRCLTAVIGREPVFATWYGRRQQLNFSKRSCTFTRYFM